MISNRDEADIPTVEITKVKTLKQILMSLLEPIKENIAVRK